MFLVSPGPRCTQYQKSTVPSDFEGLENVKSRHKKSTSFFVFHNFVLDMVFGMESCVILRGETFKMM